jgi:hypothetical protein
MECADVYVLSARRSADAIDSFLAAFAPARELQGGEFPVPMFDDDSPLVFHSVEPLVEYCCAHPEVPYSLYWRALGEAEIAFAMVFFLEDGQVIYGLSTPELQAKGIKRLLDRLADHVGSNESLVLSEQPPPDTAIEFRRAIDQSMPLSVLYPADSEQSPP